MIQEKLTPRASETSEKKYGPHRGFQRWRRRHRYHAARAESESAEFTTYRSGQFSCRFRRWLADLHRIRDQLCHYPDHVGLSP